MNDFSTHIIEKIQKEHIQPTSRWYYVMRRTAFWLVFVGSLLLGAQSVAMMLLVLLDTDVAAVLTNVFSQLDLLMEITPVIWMLFFILFVWVAYLGLHHTPKGYRIPFSWMILGNMLLTILGGIGLYTLQFPHLMDRYLDILPFYHTLEEQRVHLWSRPVKGYLGGQLLPGDPDGWVLLDFRGERWVLDFARPMPIPPARTLIRAKGRPMEDHVFQVIRIEALRGSVPLAPFQQGQMPRNRDEGRHN